MRNDDRWVYVAADEAGRHKIGCTKDLKLRMYHLSRDLGFKPVALVHSVKLDGAANDVENMAHCGLVDFPNHREWFDVSAARVIAAIDAAIVRAERGELDQGRRPPQPS